jgi:hypothetical protein
LQASIFLIGGVYKLHIIIVRNYKKKLVILSLILALWALSFFLSDYFINNSLIFNVTINNYVSFSYPVALEVDNIYIDEKVRDNVIKTNSTFTKTATQDFSTYKSVEGNFSFNYPSIFSLHQQEFPGSEILYHIDFKDSALSTHGFVQVWNMPYPLKDFLENSKAQSTLNYKDFSSKKATVNKLPGYYWSYFVSGDDGKYLRGNEVFFTKDNVMYRISYFVPENVWNKEQLKIFWNIVNSFKTF